LTIVIPNTAVPALPVDFTTRIYERSSHHTNVALEHRPAFDTNDAEHLLFGVLHKRDDIDFLKGGKYLNDQIALRPDGYVSPLGLQDALRQGISIRVRDVCRLDHRLSDWAAGVGTLLAAATEANMYVTPKGVSALRPHQDGHDVFVYQVSGEKVWSVAPPGPAHMTLPVEVQASDEIPEILDYEQWAMAPGDLLYLPRGFIHFAEWRKDISVHITFRIDPVRWHDLIAMALEDTTLSQEALRRAVAHIGGQEQQNCVAALVEATGQREIMRLAFAKALSRKRADQVAHRESWRTASLADLALETQFARPALDPTENVVEPTA
jgi:hypothetical protein